jgi:trimeric autotransporter adhesin
MRSLFIFILFLPLMASAQIITTIAGNGTNGYLGDGHAATAAELAWPTGIAVDAAGNVYVADMGNNVIRKISTSGIITTVAGNGYGEGTSHGALGFGTGGYLGDGAAATAAELSNPNGVAVDAAGNLYIADYGNNVIRKVNTAGIISTFAGGGSITINGNPATTASLFVPTDVAVDAAGNVYIADGNNLVEKVNTAGNIFIVAGGGSPGDGIPATNSMVDPTDIVVDAAGNLYITEGTGPDVRKVNTSGIISTIAGVNGTYSYSGDGGPATAATFADGNLGIAVNTAGDVFISDVNNERIREINTLGIINTVVGTGVQGYFGDGGPATLAKMVAPQGIAIDAAGNMYIADFGNNVIRKVHTTNEGVNTINKSTAAINIYPNPAHTQLFIQSTGEPVNEVTISNLLGQAVYTHEFSNTLVQVDVADLPNGMYLVRINGTEVRKFIKQ